ncbi:Protein BZZ1 [[Candida] zeylanoides]
MSLSIGNELKDAYKPTSRWVAHHVTWLSDIEDFYRERAALETEYAQKLKALAKRHFDKKAKVSSAVSVGDEPSVTPGSLECASLVLWTDVLTQTESIAQDRHQLAQELTAKVADNVSQLRAKSDRVYKKIDAINDFLTADKKRLEEEVNRAKRSYDALCQHTESARAKTERAQSEKHARKLAEREHEMNVGKNDYLININVANRLKDKYYYQDVPEVLDYLQELHESAVAVANKLVKNASIIERNTNDRVKERLHAIDATADQNDPSLDTAMFVKHNLQPDWREPTDFYFIPCEFWHDDESLVVKEPELTALKRVLAQASQQYPHLEDQCLNTKQQLEESTSERQRDREGPGVTLKFDAGLFKSLQILEQFMKDDSARVQCEVKIEVIQNFAGDQDLSYVEVKEKKKSRFGFLKGGGGGSGSGSGGGSGGGSGDTASIHTVKSTNISHGLFNLRMGKVQSPQSTDHQAKALYGYSAAGDDEISLTAGEMVTVTEHDDGSGWTMVSVGGATGLVPTSYLEFGGESSPGRAKKGPSVAPKRGAKKVQYVEALYPYAADGDDELSIEAGDRIVLVQDDTDGSGWSEGELNGRRGLFPTSYVKKV